MSTYASTLSRAEEAEMGQRIQAGLKIASERLYALIRSDRQVLKDPGADPHERASALARRERYAYGGKTYRQLKAHLWNLAQSLDHGLDILRRYGPPEGGILADRFVEANEGLVKTIVRQYGALRFFPLDEMAQIGRLGVCIAVLRFDPGVGKFSSFAHWWIKHFIKREIADRGRLIRLPVSTVTLLGDIEWSRRRFEQKHGRPPSAEEIAKDLKRKPARILEVVPHLYPLRDFDGPAFACDDEGLRLCEVTPSDLPAPDAPLVAEELSSTLTGYLDRLEPMEKGIVVGLLGLRKDRRRFTLDQLGVRFGYSREYVRLKYFRAIAELRNWCATELDLV